MGVDLQEGHQGVHQEGQEDHQLEEKEAELHLQDQLRHKEEEVVELFHYHLHQEALQVHQQVEVVEALQVVVVQEEVPLPSRKSDQQSLS